MSCNVFGISRKLIKALNSRGYQLLLNTREFMGNERIPYKYYTVSRASWNPDRNRYDNVDLYSSALMIRIVYYLRDMWYIENNMELPIDDERWNATREELIEKGNEAYGSHRPWII